MTEPTPNLQTIFRVTHDEATTAILKGVDKKTWADVAIPEFLLKAAAAKISDAVGQVLSTPLSDVLCGAWNAYRRYCKYADRNLFPAGVENEEVEEHFSIDSEHTPHIDLGINGTVRATVSFPITLTLTFDSAVIVVRNGRFVAIKTGRCTAAGKICCESAVLKELESKPLVLPGVIAFGRGIPILACH
jgi:hypothetical protein